MPPRDWRLRIADILDSIAKIRKYTDSMDFNAFAADDKTVDAVVRNITIIGEAARSIPTEITLAHPEIPWIDMGDMRNVVVHGYFGVNRKILWDTVQNDLGLVVEPLQMIVDSQ